MSLYNHTITKLKEANDETPFGTYPGRMLLIGVLGLALSGGYQLLTNPILERYTGRKQEYSQSYLEQARDKVGELRRSGEYSTIDEIKIETEPRRGASALRQIRDAIREKRESLETRVANDYPAVFEERGEDDGYPSVFEQQGEYFLKTEDGNMQIESGLYEHLAAKKPLRIKGNFLYDGRTAIHLSPEVRRILGER